MVRDPGYKLLAVLIAFVAWFWVQSQATDTVPVRIAMAWRLPEDSVSVEPLPVGATVIAQGPRVLIRRAKSELPTVQIDLREVDIGQHDVRLDTYPMEGMPSGLTVVAFTPQEVSVALDERATRFVPVTPRKVGRPAQEHALEGLTLAPDVVEVTGPRSLVDRIETVWTMPVDVSGWSATQAVPVTLDLPRGIESTQPWAGEVEVTVASLTTERTVAGVQVVVAHDDFRALEGSERASVTLKGPTDVLRALSADKMFLRVVLPEDVGTREAFVAPFRADKPPYYDVMMDRTDVITVVDAPPTVEVVRR